MKSLTKMTARADPGGVQVVTARADPGLHGHFGWRPGGADPHSEQNGSHPKNPGICFVIGFMRYPKYGYPK